MPIQMMTQLPPKPQPKDHLNSNPNTIQMINPNTTQTSNLNNNHSHQAEFQPYPPTQTLICATNLNPYPKLQGRIEREERFRDLYPKSQRKAKREERFEEWEGLREKCRREREREREREKYSFWVYKFMNNKL